MNFAAITGIAVGIRLLLGIYLSLVMFSFNLITALKGGLQNLERQFLDMW
ncbi:MAG: hypothetical protein ACJAS3_003044 [Roseivirga sp.]